MSLSLQVRLTLWYVSTLLVCLVASGALVVWLWNRMDARRFEDSLTQAAVTLATALDAEIDEGQLLPGAAIDTQRELIIPGCAFVVSDVDGHTLASRVLTLPGTALQVERTGWSDTVGPEQITWRLWTEQRTYQHLTYRIVVARSTQPIHEDAALLTNVLLLGIPFALLIAGGGGWWIARQGLRPITALATQAAGMSGREAGVRLDRPRGDDEVGRLADSFNALLGRLEQALTQQRQFMTDASHELRTPVSVVRSAAESALSRPARSDEEYRETLTIVREQSRRLGRLVDDMFLLTRADAGARPLMKIRFYLDELVEECLRAARVLADARGVSLTSTLDADVEVHADEDLMRRLIMNLVSNAVRHTPAGRRVSLTLKRDAQHVEISVRDEGSGVPQADRDRIFERFVRLPAPGEAEGGGLGLPIARWIAEAHGGTLVLSDSTPQGCVFTVRV